MKNLPSYIAIGLSLTTLWIVVNEHYLQNPDIPSENIKVSETNLSSQNISEVELWYEVVSQPNKEDKIEPIEEPKKIIPPTEEEIKLAWCDKTIKIWEVEWCKKDSELVKEVEWYETRFSRSIKNDSGYRWIYQNDKDEKFYTFEYLSKACWMTEDEWIKTKWHNYESCSCPIGYHIPTKREWLNTSDTLKNNKDLIKAELWLTNWRFRGSSWAYMWTSYISWYITNLMLDDSAYIFSWKFTSNKKLAWDAFPLRCVKD